MIIEKERFFPGTFDLVFKELFGSDENLDLTKELICSIVDDIKIEDITDIRINNGELKIKNIADNIRGGKRVDVIVETNNKLFNIELNACSRQGLDIRNSLYALQILVDQSYQVKDYNKIKKVIQINLNNFRCNKVKAVTDYRMREKGTNDIIWEHLRIVNVDMELINKSCYNKSVDELTKLELFVKGITSNSKEIIHQLGGVSEFMAKFESVIERLNNDGKILGEYDKEETDKILYNTGVNAALEQGIKQGVEQGIINTALEMLKEKIDLNVISKVTKLSLEEINKLKH